MKIIQPLVYAVLISIGIFIGNISNSENNEHENKIDNILKIIDNHYVDSINYSDFENKTINTFLNELDPHSSYISVNDYKAIEEDMNGSFSGIGVEFNIIEDSIVVISPIEGGPSQKLGIKSGDRIITVEDEDVASIGIKNENVIKILRGEKGSEVNVKIKRRGTKDPILFKIIRDDIPLVSVSAGILLDDKIGYVKINRFAATTFNEMNKKCNKLINQGMEKLILDFRGNPGGYLHISNQICDEFLKDGELIVFTEGRNRERDEIYATSNGELEDIDIICLIDEGSASASEIVSGAIQDNDRGLIIGRRSFGKGLVQEQIRLPDGSVMRLTTQRYYTPSGRCIQKDYGKNSKEYFLEQYTRNEQLQKYDSLEYKTKEGRLVYGGGGITPDIRIDRDTTLNYFPINKMIRDGVINKFCFEKSELLKKTNVKSYKNLQIASIYEDFNNYISNDSTNDKIKLGEKELKYLKNMLLANISKNIWGEDIYYEISCIEDEFVQTALKQFN